MVTLRKSLSYIMVSAIAISFASQSGADWPSFVDEVAIAAGNHTNRVYNAGSSNDMVFLVHKTDAGMKRWDLRGVNLGEMVKHKNVRTCDDWILIKGDNDDCFSCWDMAEESRSFIARLPIESALVSPVEEYFAHDSSGYYIDGTPFLVCRRKYKVVATRSQKLAENDMLCIGWLVDSHTLTTNILHLVGVNKKKAVCSDEILYLAWDEEVPVFDCKEHLYFINDQYAFPLKLLWDSDIDHSGLIPFDEEVFIDTYKAMASKNVNRNKGRLRK